MLKQRDSFNSHFTVKLNVYLKKRPVKDAKRFALLNFNLCSIKDPWKVTFSFWIFRFKIKETQSLSQPLRML